MSRLSWSAFFIVREIVLSVYRRVSIRAARPSHTLDCNLCEGEIRYD